MRAESFYNFASYIEQSGSTFGRYGGQSLHDQSHGESFLALFSNRFNRGICILDEPEAALSPQRQLTFLGIIHRLETASRA
jgi:predicted ATPase